MEKYYNNLILKTCEKLAEYSVVRSEDIKAVGVIKCDYRGSTPPPKDGYTPYDVDTFINSDDSHYWFKFSVDSAAKQGEKCYLRISTGHDGEWCADNPQGLVFVNGKITQGVDTHHCEVLLNNGKNDIAVYFYTGMKRFDFRVKPSVEYVDVLLEKAMYDFRVAYDAMLCIKEGDEKNVLLKKQLEIASEIIDFRKPYSDEFYKSVTAAVEYLNENVYGKHADSVATVNCIGHTHIDVAWLWTVAQTREKAQRSFSTVLKLMEEYPEYMFMSSQPQLFKYVKEDAPELYSRIKKAVSDGRFEPDGAMWLEPDCNLTSGESLVRQIIHGKRFFMQELGVDSKILWLPDVFGYSAALPQILRKSGIDCFVTSKISWNDTNTMPYDTFMWQGIDGTEIFTDFMTAQNSKTDGSVDPFTTYVGEMTPSMVLGTWNRYQQKEYNDEVFITYGWGDGGGGPTREMLETQRRLQKGIYGIPKTVPQRAADTLKKIRTNFENNAKMLKRTPRWVGELYLEYHRGTYTSVAQNKKNNRTCELLLQGTESAAATAQRLVGVDYPQDRLYENWEKVLLNQFHDILPGSSIKEVYDDSNRDYAAVKSSVGEMYENSLKALADGVAATDGYLVFNPTGFADSAIVEIDGEPCETPVVPSHGYTVFKPTRTENRVSVNGNIAENDYYRLSVDASGRITSLFDKENKREIFAEGQCGNELQVFEDIPHIYDNWELEPYYAQKQYVIDANAKITPFSDAVGGGFEVEHNYMQSVIKQKIRLYNRCRRVDIINDIDWQNDCQLLKAAFPFDVHTDKAVFEIQFGNVERSTNSNTSWQSAQFEVCAQKYVDVSENGYGISLLNNCKYGHSVEGSTVKLTLIKSTNEPFPHSGCGKHSFTYSIYPHRGDFYGCDTVRQAYLLNAPFGVAAVGKKSGTLSDSYSAVSVDSENVVIETIKAAYDSDATVVRLYESKNSRVQAKLKVGFKFEKAQLCDMLENPIADLTVEGDTVTVPLKNYEIATIKLI